MALYISNHGGGCCGVRHISRFSLRGEGYDWHNRRKTPAEAPHTVESIEAAINSGTFPRPGAKDHNGGRTRGKLVEAIITDTQFRKQPGLAQVMKDAGFKLVTRFSNNTGGICNVLHRVTGGRDISMAARRNPHVRTLISD